MVNRLPNKKYAFAVRRNAVLRMAAIVQKTIKAKMSLGLLVRNKRAVERARRFPSWNVRPCAVENAEYRENIGSIMLARVVPGDMRACTAVTRRRGFIQSRKSLLLKRCILRLKRTQNLVSEEDSSPQRSGSFCSSISDVKSPLAAEFSNPYCIGGEGKMREYAVTITKGKQ